MKNLLSKISIASSLILVSLIMTTFFLPCASIQAAESDPVCWGVFVGVSTYQNYSEFPYTDDDAQKLSEALSPTWGTEHVKVLLNEEATKSNILDAINWLADNAEADDTALLSLSGNGKDGGYFCAYDSNILTYSKDISASELGDAFKSVKAAKSVVILCTYQPTLFWNDLNGDGRIILMPSLPGESGWISHVLLHDIFIYHILDAFKNFDKTDADHDYALSAEEVFNYAGPATTQYELDFGLGIYSQHPVMDDQCSGQLPLLVKFSFTSTLPASGEALVTLDGVDYTTSLTPRLWVPGGSHTLSVPEIVTAGDGTRYIFTGWNDGETASTRVVSHGAFTANYKKEYLLTITSSYGSPVGAGWYVSNSNAGFSITNYIETPNTKRYFTGWSGDFTSTSATGSVIMNGPKSLTAGWRTEFLLTINSEHGTPAGAGWYGEGASVEISVESASGFIVRHIFDGWDGDLTSTDANSIVIMDGPKTITANWHTDYLQLYILIIIVVVLAGGGVTAVILIKRRKNAAPPVTPSAAKPAPSPPPKSKTSSKARKSSSRRKKK